MKKLLRVLLGLKGKTALTHEQADRLIWLKFPCC